MQPSVRPARGSSRLGDNASVRYPFPNFGAEPHSPLAVTDPGLPLRGFRVAETSAKRFRMPAAKQSWTRAPDSQSAALPGLCLRVDRLRSWWVDENSRGTLVTGEHMERSLGRMPRAAFGDMPPDTLLTADEVAAWLKVARRQVQRLGIRWIDLGRKTPRYQVKDVRAWLETRRRDGGRL